MMVITLVDVWLITEKLDPVCRACGRTSSFLAAITTLLGVVSALQLLEQFVCWVWVDSVFSVCFSFSPYWVLCLKEEGAEVGETHVLPEIWCTTCVGACSFTRLQPTITSFTWCGCSRSIKFLCGTDVIAGRGHLSSYHFWRNNASKRPIL